MTLNNLTKDGGGDRFARADVQRVFHLTFYKCGSQWVRDVLTDPHIQAVAGFRLAVSGLDLPSQPWPDIPPGTLASPLYCPSSEEWEREAKTHDRALVVLRDPRDVLVSLVFSLRGSHVPSAITRLVRGPLERATATDRLYLGMFLMSQWTERLRTWGGYPSTQTTLVTTYSRLVASPAETFGQMFDFLGWPIPESTLESVLGEHAFTAKTGRQPGEENRFSHWRKGIPRDWETHFTRDTGRVFEESFPGLLTGLGYESSADWWNKLAESLPEAASAPDPTAELLSVLEQHQNELAVVRTAAAERLTQLEQADVEMRMLQEELACYRSACEDRERQIMELHEWLRNAQREAQEQGAAAAERLRQLEELTERLRAAESRGERDAACCLFGKWMA